MKFADKLERLRKTRGLSQENIAEKCHVSRQAVSKWESGSSMPDIDNLIIIGQLFGVSLDYLVNDKIEEIIPLPNISYANNKEEILSTVIGKWCIVTFHFGVYFGLQDGWKVKILGYDDKYIYGKRLRRRKEKWCIIKRKIIKSYDILQKPPHKEDKLNIKQSDIDFNFIIEKMHGKKCRYARECDTLSRLFTDGNEITGIILSEITGVIQSNDCGILNIKVGKKIRVADMTAINYLSEL